MTVMVGKLGGPVEFLSIGQFVSGPGWRHMSRTLDSHELVFVRHGVLPMRVGDRHIHITANELALLPRGIEHAGTEAITTDLEFFWMHFRMPCADPHGQSDRHDTTAGQRHSPAHAGPCAQDALHPAADDAALPQDDQYLILPDRAAATDGDRLTVMFTQLLDLYATFGPYTNTYCNYFATSVLLEVTAQERMRRSETANDPGLSTMRAVRSWIQAHAFDDISVAKVAQRFHYSPSYLTALYRRVFNIGITEQISECRIDRARELLSSTSGTVTDIAHEVGYDDPKYFMRVFKQRTNLTPKQYREAFPARLYNTT